MTERKWTPGAWVWHDETPYGIPDVLEPYMCQGEGFIEVSDANAPLIAAAPDLYEALEEMCNWHGVSDKARTALAKARGEA